VYCGSWGGLDRLAMGLNNEVERQGDDIDWEDEEEHMWVMPPSMCWTSVLVRPDLERARTVGS
jgi:hypothetical protein